MDHPNRLISPQPRRLFSVATYNIHHWIGMDRLLDPERITSVIRDLDADVIGLQEVSLPNRHFGKDYLANATGMQVLLGPTLSRNDAHYGNALLTSHPVLDVRRHDLSFRDREPRGALDVDVDLNGITVRVIVTHLGLNLFERHYQMRSLLDILSAGPTDLVVLMGDINEWCPINPLLRKLCAWFGSSSAPCSFPSPLPVLSLDRIWVRPADALVDLCAHKTSVSRIASDHLPIKASIFIDSEEKEQQPEKVCPKPRLTTPSNADDLVGSVAS